MKTKYVYLIYQKMINLINLLNHCYKNNTTINKLKLNIIEVLGLRSKNIDIKKIVEIAKMLSINTSLHKSGKMLKYYLQIYLYIYYI